MSPCSELAGILFAFAKWGRIFSPAGQLPNTELLCPSGSPAGFFFALVVNWQACVGVPINWI